MNLEQVSHYIAHPQELTLNEAPVLCEMSEKHPYSAVFSLLYLTALANGKSVDLDAALQQHAYRLSDRTKLYHLVSAPLEFSAAEETIPVEEPEVVSSHDEGLRVVTETPVPDAKEEQEIAEHAIEFSSDIEYVVEKQDEEPSPSIPLQRGKEEIPSEEQEALSEEPEIVNISFEEPIIPTSAGDAVELETALPLDPPPKGEGEESFDNIQETEQEEVFSFITEAFTREQHFDLSETATHEEEAVPEHIPHEEIPEAVTISVAEEDLVELEFALPLDPSPKGEAEESSFQQEKSGNGEKPTEEEHEVSSPLIPLQRGSEVTPSTARSFTSWLKSAGEKTDSTSASAEEKTAESTEKRSVNDIIDNFIKEEPSITRRKTEFYSPSAKAKESLDEEAMPVSETLAKIYAAQGNYPKAIHVYHQLMLSFPEKKSLFAVQIEALKKKITA